MRDITIQASGKEFRDANFVAKSAHLLAIRPIEIELHSRLSELTSMDEENASIRISHSDVKTETVIIEADHLIIKVKFSIAVQPEKIEQEEKPYVQIVVQFAAEYQIPPEPVPEPVGPQGISAFAKIIGALAVWPYIRQEIGHHFSALGIGAMIPLLKIENVDRDRSNDQTESTDDVKEIENKKCSDDDKKAKKKITGKTPTKKKTKTKAKNTKNKAKKREAKTR